MQKEGKLYGSRSYRVAKDKNRLSLPQVGFTKAQASPVVASLFFEIKKDSFIPGKAGTQTRKPGVDFQKIE